MPTLRESLEDFAAALEAQAQDDEDDARQLRDKPPAVDEIQNTWRRIEAMALERSARRFRDLAATMRWQCGQAVEEDTDPTQVANLRKRLRLYRLTLLALASAYAVLLGWVLLLFCSDGGC